MIKMTEAQAMTELIGKPVIMTQRTMTGAETIVGWITTPLMIEETAEGEETITHATIEGMIVSTHITGIPLPIETETPTRIELLPITEITLM